MANVTQIHLLPTLSPTGYRTLCTQAAVVLAENPRLPRDKELSIAKHPQRDSLPWRHNQHLPDHHRPSLESQSRSVLNRHIETQSRVLGAICRGVRHGKVAPLHQRRLGRPARVRQTFSKIVQANKLSGSRFSLSDEFTSYIPTPSTSVKTAGLKAIALDEVGITLKIYFTR